MDFWTCFSTKNMPYLHHTVHDFLKDILKDTIFGRNPESFVNINFYWIITWYVIYQPHFGQIFAKKM